MVNKDIQSDIIFIYKKLINFIKIANFNKLDDVYKIKDSVSILSAKLKIFYKNKEAVDNTVDYLIKHLNNYDEKELSRMKYEGDINWDIYYVTKILKDIIIFINEGTKLNTSYLKKELLILINNLLKF